MVMYLCVMLLPKQSPECPGSKECAECGKEFELDSTLQRHLRYHARMRRQSCLKCGVVFRSVPFLVAHMAQEHSIFNNSVGALR